eukprot:1135497-Pyramimonas_sp.AAC.1
MRRRSPGGLRAFCCEPNVYGGGGAEQLSVFCLRGQGVDWVEVLRAFFVGGGVGGPCQNEVKERLAKAKAEMQRLMEVTPSRPPLDPL